MVSQPISLSVSALEQLFRSFRNFINLLLPDATLLAELRIRQTHSEENLIKLSMKEI